MNCCTGEKFYNFRNNNKSNKNQNKQNSVKYFWVTIRNSGLV